MYVGDMESLLVAGFGQVAEGFDAKCFQFVIEALELFIEGLPVRRIGPVYISLATWIMDIVSMCYYNIWLPLLEPSFSDNTVISRHINALF